MKRPVNNYKGTKFWRGSFQVLPVHGNRECDCLICRNLRLDRKRARKASRSRHRSAIAEQLNEYHPEYDAAMARLLTAEIEG